jgi:hypothetical protein
MARCARHCPDIQQAARHQEPVDLEVRSRIYHARSSDDTPAGCLRLPTTSASYRPERACLPVTSHAPTEDWVAEMPVSAFCDVLLPLARSLSTSQRGAVSAPKGVELSTRQPSVCALSAIGPNAAQALASYRSRYMLKHGPLIVLSVDGDAPNRPGLS